MNSAEEEEKEEMESGKGEDSEEESEEEEAVGAVQFRVVEATQKADDKAAAAAAAAGAATAAAARAEAVKSVVTNALPPPFQEKPLSPVLQVAKERMVRIMISQIQNINSNSPPMQEGCIVTLHKLCANVLSNPAEDKFRKVRANNTMVKGKVSVCRGGEDFLIAAGWRRKVEKFEPYFVFGGGGGDDGAGPAETHSASPQMLEVLTLAEDVLRKNLALAREKTERYERQKLLEKNDASMRKEEAMQAIKDDKERRKSKQTPPK